MALLTNGAAGLTIAADAVSAAHPGLGPAAGVPLTWLGYARWDSPAAMEQLERK